jgi:hypothetical protein
VHVESTSQQPYLLFGRTQPDAILDATAEARTDMREKLGFVSRVRVPSSTGLHSVTEASTATSRATMPRHTSRTCFMV